MKREEKEEAVRLLTERMMALQSRMRLSDAHASKCIKLGLVYRDEYPDECADYEAAREAYNAAEHELDSVIAAEVEEDDVAEEGGGV